MLSDWSRLERIQIYEVIRFNFNLQKEASETVRGELLVESLRMLETRSEEREGADIIDFEMSGIRP